MQMLLSLTTLEFALQKPSSLLLSDSLAEPSAGCLLDDDDVVLDPCPAHRKFAVFFSPDHSPPPCPFTASPFLVRDRVLSWVYFPDRRPFACAVLLPSARKRPFSLIATVTASFHFSTFSGGNSQGPLGFPESFLSFGKELVLHS